MARESASYTSAEAPLADGRWHQLAFVLNRRSGTATFYTDGNETGSVPIQTLNALSDPEIPLVLGADAARQNPFSGSVDEVMLWKRSLYPGEIAGLAGSQLKRVPLSEDPALLVNMRLDGDVLDASASGIHGSATPGGRFEPGVRGEALFLDNRIEPRQHVTLGEAPGLLFGESADFTVALWVQAEGDQSSAGTKSDPAFISNKDWSSGVGIGWILAARKNDSWQWNIGDGKATHRADYDSPAGTLSGGWHHLAVSHDRDGDAMLYLDAELVATVPIFDVGNIDSGLPTVLGTDGTFGARWPAWFSGALDEVKLWKRTLAPVEIRSLVDPPADDALENWRSKHFNASQLADPTVSDLNADPDGDGSPNLLEFALGTLPTDPSDRPTPVPDIVEGFFQITFLRRTDSDLVRYAPQIQIGFEFSNESWSSDASLVREVGSIAHGQSFETVTVRSLVPVQSEPCQFMRVLVSLQP